MRKDPRTERNRRQRNPARSFAARRKPGTPAAAGPEPGNPQSARSRYERYLALAQAEVRAGDMIGAENYFQHAEHYFRSISADRDAT